MEKINIAEILKYCPKGMEWIMIVFGLSYVIFFIWNVLSNDKGSRANSAFLLTISALIFFALFTSYENRNTPTAMDVYQGNTTLEYKVVDNVKVDSVVIFKTIQCD